MTSIFFLISPLQNNSHNIHNMKKQIVLAALLLSSATTFAKQIMQKSKFSSDISTLNTSQKLSLKTVPCFDANTQLFYGIYNDASTIYILLQTNTQETARNIASNGIELSFISKLKKEKCNASLKYMPASMGPPPQQEMGESFSPSDRKTPPKGGGNTPNSKEMGTKMMEQFNLNRGQFTAEGFFISNGELSSKRSLQLNAKTSWPEIKHLNIVITIPIDELTTSPYNWKYLTTKGLKMVIETSGSRQQGMLKPEGGEQGMKGGGTGNRMGGRMQGGPGGGSGMGGGGMQGGGGPPDQGSAGPNSSSSSNRTTISFTLTAPEI